MVTLILSVFIICRIFFLFFVKYKKTLLYPEYFILLPPVFIFCIPSALDGFSSLSVLTNFGLLIVFLLSLINSKSIYKAFDYKARKIIFSHKKLLIIISFFSYLYLFILIYEILNILKTSSLLAILMNNRLEGYFDDAINKTNAVGTLSFVFSFFYYLKISILYNKKKYFFFIFLILIEVFYLSLTAVTRLSIVFPVVSLLIFLSYNYKLSKKKIVIYASSVFIMIIFFMSFSNKLRTGEDVSEITSYSQTIDDLSRELNYEQYHELVLNYTNIYGFEYGYGWYLGAVVNFIPRFIYANKPITSSANRLTEVMSGEPPSMFNPVMTFTLIGDGYYQFSYIGVVINLIVFYFLSSTIFWKLFYLQNNIGLYSLIRFSFMAFIYFRAEIPFIQFFIYLILIFFVNFLSYRNNTLRPIR